MERDAASIRTLTESCISKFKELMEIHRSKRIELETRLADFKLWAWGVGALTDLGYSLDSRLQNRVSDLAVVKNILIMLADSLDYCANLTETDANSDEGVENLDSALRNLALISAGIHRTAKTARSRRPDTTFDPADYQEFKNHLECIITLRPTKGALFHQAEDGRCIAESATAKLSPLQKRLVDANLRRRHYFTTAQGYSRLQKDTQTKSSPSANHSSVASPLQARPSNVQNTTDPHGQSLDPTARNTGSVTPIIPGFSIAPAAERTPEYASHDREAAKTQIDASASSDEFLEAPFILPGSIISKCPYCCQPLSSEILSNPKAWKQHVIEDLRPYTCIADNCPTPNTLFSTRNEWETHFTDNHPPQWVCPFCEEQGADCLSMDGMRSHLQTEHKNEVQENSLPTLLSWSAVPGRIRIKSCPLCSMSAPEDSPELVDHVLSHTYEFAFRALPWPPAIVQDLNVPLGSFNLPANSDHAQRLERWINETESVKEGDMALELCHYDRADHSVPASNNSLEDSDCFSSRPSTVSNDSTKSDYWDTMTSTVTSAAFSNHGWLLASATQDRAIRLWDITTDSLVLKLESHVDSEVNSIAFSPCDRFLASASGDGTIRLWDITDRTPKIIFEGYTDPVNSVAFSQEALLFASASEGNTIRLWNIATDTIDVTLEGHTGQVNSVVFSPDSRFLASASEDGTIRLWNIVTRPIEMMFEDHTGRVASIAFSPHGEYLASASQESRIKLWDLTKEHGPEMTIQAPSGDSQVISTVFSPNGKLLASAFQNGTIELHNTTTGTSEMTFQGPSSQIHAIAFSPSSESLASVSRDGIVQLWNIVIGECVRTLTMGNYEQIGLQGQLEAIISHLLRE